jgi:putative SOS response-associated peptidase YedK
MSKDGSELDTGCILTVGANRTIGQIHDRMPVVIEPQDFSRWLDCRHGEPRDIVDLMRPADEDYFEAIPVSDLVNKVANVGPELQAPVTPPPRKQKPAADKADDGQMNLF